MEILFISRVTIWSVFQNPVTYFHAYGIHIVQFFDGGNIDGYTSLRNFIGKILTDSILGHLYYVAILPVITERQNFDTLLT